MAWNPTHEGLLAVGGGEHDQIIRLYDFSLSTDIQHTIRLNTPITSLVWRQALPKNKSNVPIFDLS